MGQKSSTSLKRNDKLVPGAPGRMFPIMHQVDGNRREPPQTSARAPIGIVPFRPYIPVDDVTQDKPADRAHRLTMPPPVHPRTVMHRENHAFANRKDQRLNDYPPGMRAPFRDYGNTIWNAPSAGVRTHKHRTTAVKSASSAGSHDLGAGAPTLIKPWVWVAGAAVAVGVLYATTE
jgi:hypothetical protein